jgi:hypothetical protein
MAGPELPGSDYGAAEGIQSMTSFDQNTALRLRYPGFRSFKAPQAIHYRHRYCRIVLVLDTFDERVSELAPADHSAHWEDVGLDCIYRRRIGARWETIRIGRTTGKDSVTTFERRLTREQTKALPGFENARMIWAKRNTEVTLQARMAALELTAHERPTTLGKLLRAILDADGSADELLALIADGTLQVDVCTVLSFWTPIRRRRQDSPKPTLSQRV